MLNRRGDRGLGPGNSTAGVTRRRLSGSGSAPGSERKSSDLPAARVSLPACRAANQRLGDSRVTCILQESSPHPYGILPAENTPCAGSDLPETPVTSHRELCSQDQSDQSMHQTDRYTCPPGNFSQVYGGRRGGGRYICFASLKSTLL